MNPNINYDPMGQAMQMLQFLNQRRAQQGNLELGQQELALRQQQMAQQGQQFDQRHMFDEQQFAQQGEQFNRRQGFDEESWRAQQERNAKLDPMQLAAMQLQQEEAKVKLAALPRQLAMEEGNYGMRGVELTQRTGQQGLMQDEQTINMLGLLPPTINPVTKQYSNPAEAILRAMLMKRGIDLTPPPLSPNDQARLNILPK